MNTYQREVLLITLIRYGSKAIEGEKFRQMRNEIIYDGSNKSVGEVRCYTSHFKKDGLLINTQNDETRDYYDITNYAMEELENYNEK